VGSAAGVIESFDANWLELREPFDAAVRSRALAERFAAALPARPVLLDLGAGTGGLFRWLAPIIARAQAWILVDNDPELLQSAFRDIADWATERGHATSWPTRAARRALLVHTPHGAWRVEAIIADLFDAPDALPMDRVNAVVCSALLDLVSSAWIERFCDVLTVPLLACLSADGRDAFLPRHPLDRMVCSGFRRDQSRDKGFGGALGRRAAAALHTALRARGFALSTALSDWRIPRTAHAMLIELVQSHAQVAARWLPQHRRAIEAWERTRLRQATATRLAIRIGHRDSLALPEKDLPGKD
jgi:hypothetical protein